MHSEQSQCAVFFPSQTYNIAEVEWMNTQSIFLVCLSKPNGLIVLKQSSADNATDLYMQ